MSTPEAGDKYRLTGNGIGNGIAALYRGQVVTVREVVPAGEPGAHDHTEDAVVVVWAEDGPVMGDDGYVTRGPNPRAMSFGVEQFADQFEEA